MKLFSGLGSFLGTLCENFNAPLHNGLPKAYSDTNTVNWDKYGYDKKSRPGGTAKGPEATR